MGAGEPGMLSPSPQTHGPLARAAELRWTSTAQPVGSVPCHYFPLVRLAIRATCALVRPAAGRIRPMLSLRTYRNGAKIYIQTFLGKGMAGATMAGYPQGASRASPAYAVPPQGTILGPGFKPLTV